MDIIDIAQQRQQEEIDHALAAHHAAHVTKPARARCAAVACDEPISPARQRMGAQLCLDCQRDAEHMAKSWARGAV